MGEIVLKDLIKEFLKNHKSYIFMYAIYLMVIPFRDILLPHLFGKLTKTLQEKQPLVSIAIITIVVWILVHVIISAIEWDDIFFYPDMMDYIRKIILKTLFEQYRDNYDDMKTTEVMVKIIKLPQLIYSYMDIWKKMYIPVFITFVCVILYIFYIDPVMGFILFVILVLYFIVTVNSPIVCSEVTEKKDRVLNDLNEDTEDVLRNMMSVLNTNNDDFEMERSESLSVIYAQFCKQSMLCVIKRQTILLPCQLFFMAFSIWRCYYLVRKNKIDVGHVISILLILMFLSNSLKNLTTNIRDTVMKHGMIKESMTVFERTDVSGNTNQNECEEKTDAQLVLKDVSFNYKKDGREILKNINLSINKGERVLIAGKIGSGKSTLIKLLMRYKNPTKGCLYINGESYFDIPINDLRDKISFIPQTTSLFNRSIFENIVYGSEGQNTIEDIQKMIDSLNLGGIFEDGLTTNVGKNGSKLSGGQRQIVLILRTFLQNPEILILDEPTASIDESTKELIYVLLEKLMNNRTIIMATHDTKIIKDASRVINLLDGEIV
jgi:ABC-type multidrug transport system fused ATPase/permease subunit